jgi:hypothetical protein
MKMNSRFKIGVLCSFMVLLYSSTANSQDLEKIVNLNGKWKFSISEKDGWTNKNFNDNNWDEIYAPSPWENEGYHGFNGFGYYRKKVEIPASLKSNSLVLHLGFIDDADEVYFNGEKIGFTGSFPPHYSTAYNSARKYLIPNELVKKGEINVIAVKVYDVGLEGGIVSGNLGIYAEQNPLPYIVELKGIWKFTIQDNLEFKNVNYNDNEWDKIMVPALWENQGYHDHDGYAWYRKQFKIPKELVNTELVLVVGYIDDIEQTYLNGLLIGHHGDWDRFTPQQWTSDDYRQLRAYYLNPSQFQAGKTNTLAIRVYDHGGGGGIYKGDVGLIKQKDFVMYWRQKNRKQ